MSIYFQQTYSSAFNLPIIMFYDQMKWSQTYSGNKFDRIPGKYFDRHQNSYHSKRITHKMVVYDFSFNQHLAVFPEKRITNIKKYKFWYLPLELYIIPLNNNKPFSYKKIYLATFVHEVLTGKTWKIKRLPIIFDFYN